MERDLRKIYREAQDQNVKMPKGHLEEFEQRLNEEFPKRRRSMNYFYWSSAAAILILVALLIRPLDSKQEPQVKEQYISLGSLSPELEKVETFYTKGVQLQWATLKANTSNKELVNSTEKRMNLLDEKYKTLTDELNENGPSEELINAMIQNLEMRMRVLIQLKGRLNDLKKTENENITKSI